MNGIDTFDEPYDSDSIKHYSEIKGSAHWLLDLGVVIRSRGEPVSYQGKNWKLSDILIFLPKKEGEVLKKKRLLLILSTTDIRKLYLGNHNCRQQAFHQSQKLL